MLSVITSVFSDVITWFTGAMGSVLDLFYADSQLTFLGVLSVAGLGIAVFLLILNTIKSFLRFK